MVTPRRIGPKKPRRIFLREWREEAEKTQQQLADLLDTSKGIISRWEQWGAGLRDPKKAREPNAGALQALAEALGLDSAANLFFPPGPSQPFAEIISHIPVNDRPQAIEILKTFQREKGRAA
jgi:transcriptional regulator with XRE-family HTH domain